MRDHHFAYFIEKFGEATRSAAVPASVIAFWENKLPSKLLAYWREEGWASYANGRLWTVNPDEYEDIKECWLEDTPFKVLDKFHVIARSAFGSLYLCGERTGRSVTISCMNSEILALKSDLKPKNQEDKNLSIQSFFGSRKPKDFDVADSSGRSMFDQAMSKFGALESDEMYGFEPALILGGSVVPSNISRVKLDSHLHMLRMLGDPGLPFSAFTFDELVRSK